jgi:hypothetical protein
MSRIASLLLPFLIGLALLPIVSLAAALLRGNLVHLADTVSATMNLLDYFRLFSVLPTYLPTYRAARRQRKERVILFLSLRNCFSFSEIGSGADPLDPLMGEGVAGQKSLSLLIKIKCVRK